MVSTGSEAAIAGDRGCDFLQFAAVELVAETALTGHSRAALSSAFELGACPVGNQPFDEPNREHHRRREYQQQAGPECHMDVRLPPTSLETAIRQAA